MMTKFETPWTKFLCTTALLLLPLGCGKEGTGSTASAGTEGGSVGARIPAAGDDHADAENRVLVRQLLTELPVRERRIVYLRYFESLTQDEIADRMGISQMHVSRLLTKSLDRLARSDVASPNE